MADLCELIERARPDTVVLPHPQLDPHPDHVCAHDALREALAACQWQPQTLLLYANHLHDNDRWPMGDSGDGVALPPQLSAAQAWADADPYIAAGVYANVSVKPFKQVLP